MNEFSLAALAFLALAGTVGYALIALRCARQERHLAELTAKLDVFLQSSIDVARCVDKLALGDVDGRSRPVASRRWLLTEAQTRLAHGESLRDVAVPLGLSQDEVNLLRLGRH